MERLGAERCIMCSENAYHETCNDDWSTFWPVGYKNYQAGMEHARERRIEIKLHLNGSVWRITTAMRIRLAKQFGCSTDTIDKDLRRIRRGVV